MTTSVCLRVDGQAAEPPLPPRLLTLTTHPTAIHTPSSSAPTITPTSPHTHYG